MDEYSGKRAAGGLVVPRKGSSLVLRDTSDNKDQNGQFCNRIGCSGRLHYTKCTQQTGCSEKPKSSRPSFRSSSGKDIIGSSSKTTTSSVVNHARKSFQKKVSNNQQTDSSESSSIQDESEVGDAESSKGPLMEVESPSVASNPRSQKIFRQKTGPGNADTRPGSSLPSASKGTGQGTRDLANSSRYGLRNLRCNSISDVLPQGCSSSESNMGRRRDIVKKRNPEGESSSSVRGKKMSGGPSSDSTISINISDSRRSARNWPPSSREIGAASVRTRRSGRLNQVNGKSSPTGRSSSVIPQVHQPELPINGNISSSLHQFSGEASSSRSSSYSRPSEGLQSLMPISSAELGISRLASRDGSRRPNMEGIAEVLLALERIEQDEELTYEQLLALESNLFLGGLSFYDQHRDMRLDIDNMSYEELLALEEKMGNVSTALSEEALCNCLKTSIYQPSPPEEGVMRCSGDGETIKCSICQEEYVGGDEVGRLGCDHGYHAVCIQQWLRLKNWCPVCKSSAASPTQSTSLS